MLDTRNIAPQEFEQFKAFLFEATGITLPPTKMSLVAGRLNSRLRHYDLDSYAEYYRLLRSSEAPQERQIAIDLLTTNETSFFREPKHFDLLRNNIVPERPHGQPLRIWSAACSSGEEPYSIAMLLADCLGGSAWEILASDISARILARAQSGHYAMERAEQIPPAYLKAYCLKGTGQQAGTLLIEQSLRRRIRFASINLNAALPQIGVFDVVFLRNVMIYFNAETKRQVISRISAVLPPGGYLFIGHSESLHGITEILTLVQPGVYRKPS